MLESDLGPGLEDYDTLVGDSANDLPTLEYLPNGCLIKRRFGPSFNLPDMRPGSVIEVEEDLTEEINRMGPRLVSMDLVYDILNDF